MILNNRSFFVRRWFLKYLFISSIYLKLHCFIVFDEPGADNLSAILGQTWLQPDDSIISKFLTHNLTNNSVCLADHFSLVFIFRSLFELEHSFAFCVSIGVLDIGGCCMNCWGGAIAGCIKSLEPNETSYYNYFASQSRKNSLDKNTHNSYKNRNIHFVGKEFLFLRYVYFS